MPGWYHASCASSLVSKPDHLQQWWWANIVGAASGVVLHFMNKVVSEVATSANVVKGLSLRNYKQLRLDPVQRASHASLIEAWAVADIKLGLVDLGTGQTTIVRAVSTGDYLPSVSSDSDERVNDSFADQAQRLVEITWILVENETINGRQAMNVESSSRKLHKSLHYITKFDTTKRWFLFEEEVVVTCPQRMRFDIYVVFGPWAGHGKRFFGLASDPSIATAAAEKVCQVLPVRNILQHLVSASSMDSSSKSGTGGLYLGLGGPGVGKTSGCVMEIIRKLCQQGKERALLFCSLAQGRNMHAEQFRRALGESVSPSRFALSAVVD